MRSKKGVAGGPAFQATTQNVETDRLRVHSSRPMARRHLKMSTPRPATRHNRATELELGGLLPRRQMPEGGALNRFRQRRGWCPRRRDTSTPHAFAAFACVPVQSVSKDRERPMSVMPKTMLPE